jgi:tetratricopeptide (TPR) repeat protein
MYCYQCGNKGTAADQFCSVCGGSLKDNGMKDEGIKAVTDARGKHRDPEKWKIAAWVIAACVVLAFFGYSSIDDTSVDINNEGINYYDSTGDSDQAILTFKESAQSATMDDNKVNSYKNLAFVYVTEGEYEKGLAAFEEALSYASDGSFDYFLISAEIALINNKPNAAKLAYEKAYELKPQDFQVNNGLALFYLNLDELAPAQEDFEKALFYAKRAYEFDPEKLELNKQNLALSYYLNGNFDKTISLSLSSNFENYPYSAYLVGLAYLGKDDHDKAKYYFNIAKVQGAEIHKDVDDYLNSF